MGGLPKLRKSSNLMFDLGLVYFDFIRLMAILKSSSIHCICIVSNDKR